MPRNASESFGQRTYALPDGTRVPSVTTHLNVLDKPWMGPWVAKLVAEEAYDRRSWWQELPRDQAIAHLKGFPFRKRDEAAEHGTAVHEVAERIALGEDFIVPERLRPHERALREWHALYQPRVVAAERQVYGPGYAGTFDLLIDLYGERLLVDLKTSKSLDAKWRLQLAAYTEATGLFYDKDWLPWPDDMPPDDGAILWVPSDRPEEWQFLRAGLTQDDIGAWYAVRELFGWTTAHKADIGYELVPPQEAA